MGRKRIASPSSIGRSVRIFRHLNGYTGDELGKVTGVAKAHLSELENGYKFPSQKMLKTLAEALNVKGSDVLRLAELMEDDIAKPHEILVMGLNAAW